MDEIAWYVKNSSGKTYAIGGKKPNAFGLYDMLGNVSEWTEDWFDENYYVSSPVADPMGSESGRYRVFRGGSWVFGYSTSRVSYRDGRFPTFRNFTIGLRLVLPLPK